MVVRRMIEGKVFLITGGTGFFGKKIIETILKSPEKPKKIIIFSRDELKQSEMRQEYPAQDFPQLRFFVGDVRDRNRLIQACDEVDVIIHAAAIKRVDVAEYNPTECIRTNIGGAENVIHASLQCGIKDVVSLSTDKACAPINLYGATKLASDKLFTAANNIRGSRNVRFSVVRYGNVIGSRGSVIPLFLKKRSEGILPITDKKMTRFNISIKEGIDLVMYALKNHLGGEIFVPKIPSYRIMDVAEAVAPGASIRIDGIRPGEKLNEEMITDTDSLNTIDMGKYYAILPSVKLQYTTEEYMEHHGAVRVPFGFKYNSGLNKEWETVKSLRSMIRQHVDSNFIV